MIHSYMRPESFLAEVHLVEKRFLLVNLGENYFIVFQKEIVRGGGRGRWPTGLH